jgi:20S proteasome alpha/beta subunit
MSVEVVRIGKYIEVQFTGAEIIETWGKRDELYGDGVITLTLDEAIKLAKELLEAVLEEEATEEEEVKEEVA